MTKPLERSELLTRNSSLKKQIRKSDRKFYQEKAEKTHWKDKYDSLLLKYREILIELTKSERRFDNQQECIEILNNLLDKSVIKTTGKSKR